MSKEWRSSETIVVVPALKFGVVFTQKYGGHFNIMMLKRYLT